MEPPAPAGRRSLRVLADEPPKPKVPSGAEKKKMDDLDKLGSDISGKLGK